MSIEQLFQLQELHLQAANELGYIRGFKEAVEFSKNPEYLKADIEQHQKAYAAITNMINRATMPDSLFDLLLQENLS